MWQRDGGVDILCAIDGTPHKLRFRFYLDASRTVRLMATGVAGAPAVMVKAEVTAKGVKCSPPKFKGALVTCLRNSADILGEEARTYLRGFTPQCLAMLDLTVARGAMQYVRSLQSPKLAKSPKSITLVKSRISRTSSTRKLENTRRVANHHR